MLALVLTVPAGEAELAADALWALGVLAVEERSAVGAPLVELWTSLGEDSEAVAGAAAGFPARWRWHLAEVDETVADAWRRHATPTWIEHDLVVRPEWVGIDAEPGTTVVAIEPGSTFGLGDHPTTVLTLRALYASLFPGAVVLDVGCGSGVLAVTACLLGAARAEAVDVSLAAVAVARANAERNGVGSQVTVGNQRLADVEGEFDVVLANILAPALIDLSADLCRLTGPGGVLVISGMLAGRAGHVLDALAPMHVVDTHERDGWVAVTLRH
jgi:ribosomal protein L11 methyltransferase